MAAKIIIRDLVKRYGATEAVRGVSFEAGEGEILGLLGPNGAGKTSTLECVIGLRQPDGGTISLCGIDAAKSPAAVKQKIGAVLQSTALQDRITPREALSLFGSFYKQQADVEKLLRRFSLQEKSGAPFESLSGGQKQRLALALAFVNDPEVLFLDEPTAGLDPQSRRELHQAILAMKKEGRTVILTTHYIEEAEMLCDRVAIIDHGRIIAIGSPADLIARSKALTRIFLRAECLVKLESLLSLEGVKDARISGENFEIHASDASRAVIGIVQLLEREGNPMLDLEVRSPSLEDVFIEMTGASLRD